MLVVFLDANIFFAAVRSDQGGSYFLMELAKKKQLEIVSTAYALAEAEKNITKKLGSEALARHYQNLLTMIPTFATAVHEVGIFVGLSIVLLRGFFVCGTLSCSIEHEAQGLKNSLPCPCVTCYKLYVPLSIMIPESVTKAVKVLQSAEFEAYLVGGCVRDLLLEREPKDWDITTNARPDQIEAMFSTAGYKTFYENAFGTVTAIVDELPIEITPYRLEGKYSDRRHPDEITWAKTLAEDLGRRDFTINSMALALKAQELKAQSSKLKTTTQNLKLETENLEIVDLFGGQEDLKMKIIRTVGDADARFNEDALRLLRAVRFAGELKFTIEEKTYEAIVRHALLLERIAKERVRDELIKILQTDEPEKSVRALHKTGLLNYLLPEIEEGVGVTQRGPHRFDVFSHNLYSLKWAARESDDLVARLAAFLHDVAKPRVRQEQKGIYTFYDHQVVGAKMAEVALERLHFPKKIIEEVTHLIYHHMFYYDVGKVTPSGVRRLLARVGGKDVFEKLLIVRRADRRATPVPKTHPYRLRHLQYMMEKVASDPLSRSQLVITGDDIKQTLGIPEGIRVGLLLNALLVQVLDDPQKNTREYVLKEAKRLNEKSDKELAVHAKEIDAKRQEREDMLKGKYYVT